MSEININWNKQLFLKLLEIMTLTAIVCLTISEFGGYYLIITTIGKHSRLLRKIAFALFVVKIMLTRYTKRESLVILLMSIFGYLNYNNSGNIEMIMSIAMILSLKNIKLKEVFLVCFFSVLSTVVLLGSLSSTGITGDLQVTMNYGRGGMETRYCFGFYHPNQWAYAVFMLLAFGTVAFWERLNWKIAIIMTILNLTAYKLAISRTAVICGIVLICMAMAYKYGGRLVHGRKMNYSITLACAAIWGGSIFLISNLADGWYQKIDRLFNGRIAWGKGNTHLSVNDCDHRITMYPCSKNEKN